MDFANNMISITNTLLYTIYIYVHYVINYIM